MQNLTSYEKTILIIIACGLALSMAFFCLTKSTQLINSPSAIKLTPSVDSLREMVLKSKQVNINQADAGKLSILPGIGEILAKRIMEHRQIQGPFISKKDLMKVKGIGPVKYGRIKDLILLK
jgi:competence protein ComEA